MYCVKCNNLHKTSAITTTDTNLVLTFADNPTDIINEQHFCFIICQDIPATGAALATQLTVNGAAVPLWDKYGNLVPGCGLKKGIIYRGYFGTGTADHVISSMLPLGYAKVSYACEIEETT